MPRASRSWRRRRGLPGTQVSVAWMHLNLRLLDSRPQGTFLSEVLCHSSPRTQKQSLGSEGFSVWKSLLNTLLSPADGQLARSHQEGDRSVPAASANPAWRQVRPASGCPGPTNTPEQPNRLPPSAEPSQGLDLGVGGWVRALVPACPGGRDGGRPRLGSAPLVTLGVLPTSVQDHLGVAVHTVDGDPVWL